MWRELKERQLFYGTLGQNTISDCLPSESINCLEGVKKQARE
jgi:hypothetical protein